MATADGYLDQRTRLNTLTTKKMTKATEPAAVVNKVATLSLEPDACSHACAKPHQPMTGTNQTGERCSKALEPCEEGCILTV